MSLTYKELGDSPEKSTSLKTQCLLFKSEVPENNATSKVGDSQIYPENGYSHRSPLGEGLGGDMPSLGLVMLEACTQLWLGRTVRAQQLEPRAFGESLQSQCCRIIFLEFLAEEGKISTVRYARTFYFVLFLLTRSIQ